MIFQIPSFAIAIVSETTLQPYCSRDSSTSLSQKLLKDQIQVINLNRIQGAYLLIFRTNNFRFFKSNFSTVLMGAKKDKHLNLDRAVHAPTDESGGYKIPVA